MDKRIELQMAERQESNRVLVQLISNVIEAHPELRFHQILHALDVVVPVEPGVLLMKDLFHEESVKTLDRVSKAAQKIK